MRTLDEQGSKDYGVGAIIKRDLQLMTKLAGMIWYYFTSGRKIRNHYDTMKQSRGTYWLDEDDAPPPNEDWRKGAGD